MIKCVLEYMGKLVYSVISEELTFSKCIFQIKYDGSRTHSHGDFLTIPGAKVIIFFHA